MKITKIFMLIIGLVLLLISFYQHNISIGNLWRNYHSNSLIGFQKIIESNNLLNQLNIWFNILVPILKLDVIFLLSIILFLLSFNLYKK